MGVQLPTGPDAVRNIYQQADQEALWSTLKRIGNAGGLGLAVGGSLAGLGGLAGLVRSALRKPRPATPPGMVVIDVPTNRLRRPAPPPEPQKVANDLTDYIGHLWSGKRAPMEPSPASPGPTRWDLPMEDAGKVLAFGAGAGLGYGGLNYALKGLRERETEQELAEARKKYRAALYAEYEPIQEVKVAAAPSTLGQKLAYLYRLKQASMSGSEFLASLSGHPTNCEPGKPYFAQGGMAMTKSLDDWKKDRFQSKKPEKKAGLEDWARSGLGTYTLYGALTGVPAAYYGYQLGQRNSSGVALEKALKERERRRLQQQPYEVFARPVDAGQQVVPEAEEFAAG